MKDRHFWAAALLLAGAFVLLHARSDTDKNPPSLPVAQFPNSLNGWNGTDQPIDQETLDVLGAGEFLSRVYTKDAQPMPMGLFIAYFPTQRTGQTIHSPKHCLPGAGWVFDSSHYVTLDDVNGKPYHVGEYVISNSGAKQFVIYWYQAHGRSVAGEYKAKLYMIADAIRLNRTDGALVRVITPIGANEDLAAAKKRAEKFTERLMPLLPRFIPN